MFKEKRPKVPPKYLLNFKYSDLLDSENVTKVSQLCSSIPLFHSSSGNFNHSKRRTVKFLNDKHQRQEGNESGAVKWKSFSTAR